MKLTKSIRRVILIQFKQGDDMEYLAKLYGFTLERIEQVIRQALIKDEEIQVRWDEIPSTSNPD